MDILNTLLQLGGNLIDLAKELYLLLVPGLLLFAWIAWWLWAVNWRRAFPILAQGAWAPLVLLMVVSALVWSRIAPSQCDCLGFPLRNFWWQIGAVGLYVGVALFCGWLQLYLHWSPPEINLEPAVSHDAGHDAHGHGHGHESAHASHDPGHAAHH
jgi:hypothetical protein